MQVYLNGSYIDHSKAAVSVDDRGFLFADGIYEVVRVYHGELFLAEPHWRRLRQGLAALRISGAGTEDIDAVARRLVAANDVTGDGTVYIQVTRGVAPRRHAFPAPDVKPSVYAFAKPFTQYPAQQFTDGVAAISTPDTRWSRCDIKTIALLPNVLANQEAHAAGAFEALFVRDGVLIEGSHSNLFGVVNDTLVTYPSSNYILTGITRNLVLELARDAGIPTAEAPILWDQRPAITELFLSGTTTEVMPVTRLDGQAVGDGRRGPITTRLQQAFRDRIEKVTGHAASAA
ncbi:MAG: D-amino-acid transaminase [Gemmatimonadota bacterium]